MLAARLEKAPRSERLCAAELLKEMLVPLVLVVPGEEEEELVVAASVGASPGPWTAGRPVIAGMA